MRPSLEQAQGNGKQNPCMLNSVTRRRLSTDARRKELLEVGKTIFSQHAFDDVSTNDLAEMAGISKGLLYHYFKNKRGYYVETIRAAAEELITATEPNADLTPPMMMVATLQAYLDHIEVNERLFRAVTQGGIGSDPECKEIIDRFRHKGVTRIYEAFGIDKPPPRLRARLVAWVGANEFLSLDWIEHRDIPKNDIIQMMVTNLAPIIKEELADHPMVKFLKDSGAF